MGNVLFEVDSLGVGTITIDYPQKRNILSETIIDQLNEIILNIKTNQDQVKALVIRSKYKEFFSAGGDIKEWYSYQKSGAYQQGLKGGEIFQALENIPVLTIASISGTCLGGGSELSLACDIRIATNDSVFGQPETILGNGPSWGGYYRLARKIGMSRTREMILLGDTYSAKDAYQFGLVNQLVTDWDELLTKTYDTARKAAKNQDTIMVSKQILNVLENEVISNNLMIDAQSAAYFANTETSNLRKKAFLEKRLHEVID